MQAPGRGSPRARSRGGCACRSSLPLVALAAVLNLWALSRNGWANDYYSAAVRSMSSSWHNFLFASLDPSGVMTVDKPPLALWVQALSVRAVRLPPAQHARAPGADGRRERRARLRPRPPRASAASAASSPGSRSRSRRSPWRSRATTTPTRCSCSARVAALWFAVRALEDGRTRWLVLAGVCVGLGFETKMRVALTVVPGIAPAWLWVAPAARGRLHALRQLLAGGAAMMLVGGAWPALVELIPAVRPPVGVGHERQQRPVADLRLQRPRPRRRPGRRAGWRRSAAGPCSAAPPARCGCSTRRSAARPAGCSASRSSGGVAILLASRLRRRDERSGWLIVVGGALPDDRGALQRRERHLPPLLRLPARAVRRGARRRRRGPAAARRPRHPPAPVLACSRRWRSPRASRSSWSSVAATPASSPGSQPCSSASALAAAIVARVRERQGSHRRAPRRRGRADARSGGLGIRHARLRHQWHVPRRRPVGRSGRSRRPRRVRRPLRRTRRRRHRRRLGRRRAAFGLGGSGGQTSSQPAGPEGGTGSQAGGPGEGPGGAQGAQGAERPPAGGPPSGAGGFAAPGGGAGAIGAPFGQGRSLSAELSYTRAHGGGTIAVSSQSSAASSIIEQDAEVAGIGGFSGRESDVSVSWLAQEVRRGRDPLGARRRAALGRIRRRPAGRYAQRLDGRDGRRGEGLHTSQPEQLRVRLGLGIRIGLRLAVELGNALRLPGPRRRAHGARRAEVSLLTRASPVRGVRRDAIAARWGPSAPGAKVDRARMPMGRRTLEHGRRFPGAV